MQDVLFNAVIRDDFDVIISGAKLKTFSKIVNADAPNGVTYSNLMSITQNNISKIVREYYESIVSENIENNPELGEFDAKEKALESLNNVLVDYIPDIANANGTGYESVEEVITAIMRCDAFSYWQSKIEARFKAMSSANPMGDTNKPSIRDNTFQDNNIFVLLETLSSISNDNSY